MTVSNGDAYNVATEIDTEVYNQIASWYNEDATTEDKDTAGNGTLPLTPSGPGSQPAKQNAFTRWFKDNWGKSWFIAVVIIVCVGILGRAWSPLESNSYLPSLLSHNTLKLLIKSSDERFVLGELQGILSPN